MRYRESPFMTWAKTSASATYNFANSGISLATLEEQKLLGITTENLPINGGSPYGSQSVKDKIAKLCAVKPEEVFLTSSVSMANFLVMSLFLDADDEVLIEDPTYDPFLANAKFLNAKIKFFSRRFTDNFQPDLVEVEKNLNKNTKLIILSSPHNPSGIEADQKNLRVISELTENYSCYILVDEIFRDINPEPNSIAYKLGENFISVNGFSKCYGFAALRFGWVIADQKIVSRLNKLHDLIGIRTPNIVELTAEKILDNHELILKRARDIITKNHRSLNNFFKSCEGRLISKVNPWSVITFSKFTKEFKELCADSDNLLKITKENAVKGSDISFAPGSFFNNPDCFRLGFGGDPEIVRQGLDRFAIIIDSI